MRIDVIHAIPPARGGLGKERETAIRNCGAAGTRIVIRLPADGPLSIASAYEDAIATPNVLAEVLRAAGEGADALVINCTADTGVAAAREAVAIPVIGVAEASFHLAAQLARRFSVLTFAARIAPRFAAMAELWGLSRCLASTRSIETPLEALPSPDALAKLLAHAARACVEEDGAQALILGCTDFELAAAPLGRLLQEHDCAVPILKPCAVGIWMAEALVSLGLSHSRSAYPTPNSLKPDREGCRS